MNKAMYPYVSVLGREISLYAVMGMLGVGAAALFVFARERRNGLGGDDVALLAATCMIGGMVGAKLLFLLTQAGQIRSALALYPPGEVAKAYLSAGFVFYGGLLGGVAALYGYARYHEKSFSVLLRGILPAIPLVHGFGRVGCFLAGCCHGIPWPPPVGIAFARSPSAPNHVHLFPVQLLEAAALFIIFAVLWRVSRRPLGTLALGCLYLGLYAPVRFALEFLRGDVARGFLWGLSTSQLISIVLFAGAAACFALCQWGRLRKGGGAA